ncbi:extracellular solute-binding protein [Oceanispirochaeta sp.]|jgi:multiple sugar transport system substrate-binding protein|uniref:sugar ABC transporter substrate-binding protein n=1 Tax=Oceanispirochaeta sp. TaxID=2035350 RepID=UPI00260AC9BE|nr:extracellular solute-binding protein [Oceanispirochaeta sp.]MDA3957493.1 extracellular solute-binding protein [Oceanispirochaeta sp.]
MLKRNLLITILSVLSLTMVFSGGQKETGSSAGSTAAKEPIELSMWYHGAGNDVERKVLIGIINDFNSSQSDYSVVLEEFPEESYNDSVMASALAGNLPDIIDVDGPIMPNWAWAGYLAPLELSKGAIDGFLPGAIGTWDGKVYSVGLWDAAIAMFARKSILEKYNIRIPTLAKPWTGNEFEAILTKLQASGEFDYALDLGTAWTGEWYAYAFAPFMQSFGGDLIDRDTYTTAEGILNGAESIAFGKWWQSLFERGLVPPIAQDSGDRDTGFIDGKYALQWNGNWAALGALDAYGDDMLYLPAPDFGNGPKIGSASWQLGVSATSQNKKGASAFIEFALQDKYLAAFTNALGLVPATSSSAAMTENYKAGGPLEGFYELSNVQGMIRPVTPGYVVMSKVYEKALTDIANGADVESTLDAAVDEIEIDIENNSGYGF